MVNPMVLFLSFCFGLIREVPRINRAIVSLAPERGANAAREGEPGLVGEGLVAESGDTPVSDVQAGGGFLGGFGHRVEVGR